MWSVWSLAVLCVATAAGGEEPPAGQAIAARVNGEPISWSEVADALRQAYGDREPSDERRREAALTQLIDRRLVLAALTRLGQAASSQDVDLALAQFTKELAAQNLTLAEHCRRVGLTEADIRRSLAWKLSWQRYLSRQLNEQNLERYFARHRREFDGTELRVAQILLKPSAPADEAAVRAALERARQWKADIAAGKLTFAEAARQHSQAPSAAEGGDIGWIERHRPMPEDFSRAAFGLAVGAISEPLVTPFGVHLITVLEEKPGQKTWREAENELRPAAALYLFRWLADQERPRAQVERKP